MPGPKHGGGRDYGTQPGGWRKKGKTKPRGEVTVTPPGRQAPKYAPGVPQSSYPGGQLPVSPGSRHPGTPHGRLSSDKWAGTTGTLNGEQLGGFESQDVYVTVPVDKVVVSQENASSIAPTYQPGAPVYADPGGDQFPQGQAGKGSEAPDVEADAGAFQAIPIGNPAETY